jgi:hypothetical protein
MKLKKPSWLLGLFDLKPVIDQLITIKNFINTLKLPKYPENAIPVRLSDGEKFYKSISGGSSSGAIPPFKKSDGVVEPALIDKDNHAQVDVLTMPTVQIKDGTKVNVTDSVLPTGATKDNTVVLLRRLINLLESNAVVDPKRRQKVVIDAVGTVVASGLSTEVTTTLPVSGAVTSGTAAGINSGNIMSNTPPYLTNTAALAVYQQVWEGPVDQRYRVAEDSHISYQVGIRSHLAFS